MENRLTVPELIDRVQGAIEARLENADARLRRNLLFILSVMQAELADLQYARQEYIEKNILPDTAESEFLERWTSIWGIIRVAALYAAGNIVCAGVDGEIISAGKIWQRSDGFQYEVTTDTAIAAGTATVPVLAMQAGADGIADAGVTLTITSTIPNVDSTATVDAGGIVGGTEAQSDDVLFSRLKDRLVNPPQGGSRSDYVAWVKQAHPAVTRVWTSRQEAGPNSVTVRFVTDDEASIIPTPAIVDAVQAYIDQDDIKPWLADVFVIAPDGVALDLDISLDPNDAATQAAVTEEIADMLKREAEPGGTIALSKISEAISIAAGEVKHILTSPVADVTHAVNEIAIPGVITFSDYP